MLFHSIAFIVFFLAVCIAYFLLPHRARWAVVLIASLYFFMSFKPEYVILLLASILSTYVAAVRIHATHRKGVKKAWLAFALVTNLGLLAGFKYANFLGSSAAALARAFGIGYSWTMWSVIFPIGISFYTFQVVSYVVDVYRGSAAPERHLGIYAAAVSFFPKLVAGPLERLPRLLPQFREVHKPEWERIVDGLVRMLWGLFKKIVVADRLALFVNAIFAHPGDFNAIALVLGAVGFGFQLYADFSGYTDIALGAAQVLGFGLTRNFNRPFIARSPADFWRRWHISLSNWFQDYVFTPTYLWFSRRKAFARLGSSQRHMVAFFSSLVVGEALLGLWHGPGWTYVAFGLYYALWIFLYYALRGLWDKMAMWIQRALTFVVVTGAWVLFRASTLGEALRVFEEIFLRFSLDVMALSSKHLPIARDGIILAVLGVAVILSVEAWDERQQQRSQGRQDDRQNHIKEAGLLRFRAAWLRGLVCILLMLAIVVFGVFESVPFIYAQF